MTIKVEVAYALPTKQKIIEVDVPEDSIAYDVVIASSIVDEFPEIDPETAKMGIFGKAIKPKEQRVRTGDRIEIYRPLLVDPKDSRKARAARASAKTD